MLTSSMSIETQIWPVNDPQELALTKTVNEAFRAYDYAPANEPNLTIPSKVLQDIKGLVVGKD